MSASGDGRIGGFSAPNHTQTPNAIFDELLPLLGDAELRVVLAIVRATHGWHKARERVSISQLEERTGLSRQGVINGINAALERGIIDREEIGQGYSYGLVVNGVDQQLVNEVDQKAPEVVNEVDRSGAELVNEVDRQLVNEVDPLKESFKEKYLIPQPVAARGFSDLVETAIWDLTGMLTRANGGRQYAWVGQMLAVLGKHSDDNPELAIDLLHRWWHDRHDFSPKGERSWASDLADHCSASADAVSVRASAAF